jgi:hypothetical protein
MLRAGQELSTPAGRRCRIRAFLGGGSQGEVYEVELGDSAVALKWYLPGWATAGQRRLLQSLVSRPPPGPAFLWPLELVTAPEVAGYGYLMRLREQRFVPMSDVMRRRVEPRFGVLATAGLHLAHNFLLLHAQGLCYRDISFGNVAIDPATGEVVIADNDNVAVDGVGVVGLLGTPRFMAPEIVRGDAVPGTQTDLYSLAVLLFYLFVVHHPLEGRRERAFGAMDLAAMTRLYGTEALFVFDPDDDSNRPQPDGQRNALTFWPLYPTFLRELFTRAFTAGIRDPRNSRVREGEWRQAMAALRDLIVYCAQCGAENFADRSGGPDSSVPAALRPAQLHCWSCGAAVVLPMHLDLGRSVVMLNHDTRLFPHHLDPARRFDFGSPWAEVTAHPADRRVWGLRNLSDRPWRAATPAGSVYEIAPGQSIRLTPGSTIDFREVEGRVGAGSSPTGGGALAPAAAPRTGGRP